MNPAVRKISTRPASMNPPPVPALFLAISLGATLCSGTIVMAQEPLPTLLAKRGELIVDDDGSRGREDKVTVKFDQGVTSRAWAGKWQRSPGDENGWRSTWAPGMGHTPVVNYTGFDEEDLVAEVTFRFGRMSEPWQHQCFRIAFDRRPEITGHILSAWANPNNDFIESGFLLQHIRKTPEKKIIEDLLLDFQDLDAEPETWHTAILEVAGDEALFRMGDHVAYAKADQVRTSKNLVSLTLGTTWHEVRRVRIWRAEPHPEWEERKPGILAARHPWKPQPHRYSQPPKRERGERK